MKQEYTGRGSIRSAFLKRAIESAKRPSLASRSPSFACASGSDTGPAAGCAAAGDARDSAPSSARAGPRRMTSPSIAWRSELACGARQVDRDIGASAGARGRLGAAAEPEVDRAAGAGRGQEPGLAIDARL